MHPSYLANETMDAPPDIFNAHRSRLFGIAYRMLGAPTRRISLKRHTSAGSSRIYLSCAPPKRGWLLSLPDSALTDSAPPRPSE